MVISNEYWWLHDGDVCYKVSYCNSSKSSSRSKILQYNRIKVPVKAILQKKNTKHIINVTNVLLSHITKTELWSTEIQS